MVKKNKPSKLGEILKNITKQSIKDNAAKEREKSYDIRKIFEQMELDLISSMRRAFYFHQNEQEKEGFEWEQWQLSKLRAMEQYRARNKKIVGKYNKPIQEAIDRELQGNFSKGENVVARFIDKVKQVLRWRNKEYQSIEFPDDIDTSTLKGHIAKALGSPGAIPHEKKFFGVNEKKLEALIKTVNNDLNKAQYSVLRKMDDVYRQTIFKSHMYLQNGAKTLNQAIGMATKDFLDKGINSIEYKNGARVNIASYAEMCLRTASHRATLLGEGKKRDEYGIHLIVVSAHGNTCKMCEPWQGEILIDDIFSHPSKEYIDKHKVKYKLLSEAIEKGLLHPNCRHTLTTYFPGITTLPVVPDGKKAIKVYEAEQKQRTLERQIRKWKRIEAGSVDEENKIKAANNVRALQNKLK
ncbi:phage minor capsid protein [Clostridium sp.]|uniref:phage minor capsid protein n=1 Tax=Clostridium sp. TaxID=1506 RepID=UPI0025C3F2A2|nr:phage minor capsid protein [Clostridium sp.]